jgi:hypothetical protein
MLIALLAPAMARAHDEDQGDPHADHRDTPAELADVNVAREVRAAELAGATAGDDPLQASATLPTTWCGVERTTDDGANNAVSGSLAQFKVIYLHPSDRPDRFAQWKDLLQADASLIGQFVSGQSGSSRAPRFDLGTSCGQGYVDIQTVHLPSPRASYVDNYAAIKAAVNSAIGAQGGPRNYVVVADTLNGSASGSYGLGDYYAGSPSAERPDAANPHNNGNLFAVLFYRDIAPPAASANGWWPTGMLHEMTHTMGAVQWSAPHTTQPAGGSNGIYGHCWDGLDIMCYADGPAMGHSYDSSVCGGLSGAMNQTYDCNQDDYFNPSPAAGSYLATHWDVYNNVFLADCGTLPSGTCVAPAATGPPVSSAAPVITGTARRGQTLTATMGMWSPAGTSYAYQWQRDTGSVWTDISGATASTYVLALADVGAQVRVHVTATNASGTGQVDADPLGPVADRVPLNTTAPVVSGGVQGGRVLSASLGAWSPAGTSYAFQWQRDTGSGWTDISGATSQTYTTVVADVGATVRAQVTATNAFGTLTASSAGVGPIGSGVPASTAAPTITGVAKRGQALAANGGSWNPAGASYTFKWQRDTGSGWTDVSGATASGYTPVAADLTAALRVVVTATNGFGTTSAPSNPTAAVAPDPPVSSGVPTITGMAKRTFTMTATAGLWSPAGSSFAYQWQRDSGSGWTDIGGATAPGYALVAADVGAQVRVRVTATNPDGSATATSGPSGTVVPAVPAAVSAPVIAGTTKAGDTLNASNGAWNPAAASYAYQWQRRSGATFADIAGATSSSYTLVAADVGTAVRVKVTGTNADGSGIGYSNTSATVTSPPAVTGAVPAPSGTLQDASVLTAQPGTWTPGATFTYQWLRCPSGAADTATGCVTVAMGPAYILAGEDVGHAMAVRVTARTAAGSVAVPSATTADVTGRPLTAVVATSIGGSPTIAETVRAAPALWSVPIRTTRYQWQRCDVDGSNCADIPNAGGQVYTLTVADRGKALAVRETATSPGRTASVTSAAVVVADQPLPVMGTAPAILGTAARTMTLTVRLGTWGNRPTSITYAWQRCEADSSGCVPISPRGTGTTYTLVAADVGHTVTVVVSATNTSGTSTAIPPVTAVVAPMLAESRVPPAILGNPQVPNILQAGRSAWKSTADTRYAYRWRRCDAAGLGCVDIPTATGQAYKLKVADARSTLRVVHVATNVDGSVAATSAATPVIKPALPGIATYPRISLAGRPDVGRTATITPGIWAASTEIDTKALQFWRCSPRCAALPTGGAGTYDLDVTDAGAFIRGSETATGPGGSFLAWAPSWIGPVRSISSGFRTLAAGSSAVVRSGAGVAMARVTVGPPLASAARTGGARRAGTVRIALRRSTGAPRSLRAWACATPPSTLERQPCTKAVRVRGRATLKLAVAKGQRVAVVVTRAPRR